jgi:hypothetical protein
MSFGNISLDKDSHTYTDSQGNLLPSCSEIIRNYLGDKFQGVNQEVLKKAQEFGNIIHQQVEDYLVNGIPFTEKHKQLKEFMKLKRKFGIRADYCETTILGTTEFGIFGATIDLLDNKSHILYDIKTNYMLDIEYVTIQLSIYAFVLRQFGFQVKEGKVIYLPSNKSPNKADVITVKLLSDDEVTDIIRRYFEGVPKEQPTLVCLNENKIQKISQVLQNMKDLKQQIDNFEEELKNEMAERGILSIENDCFKVTYTPPSTRIGLNTAKFKKEQAKLFEEYSVITDVSDKIRITLKTKKEDKGNGTAE